MKTYILMTLLMATSVLGCKDDVFFVVDESEMMRSNQWTYNQRTGFQRVNDQIIDYLQAVSTSPAPGLSRAGYITIGMNGASRGGAKQVTSLNSNLNAVIDDINRVNLQNFGLRWDQVVTSLPAMVTKGSKVVVITANEPSPSERSRVSDMFTSLGADVYVIGLPFQSVLHRTGLEAIASESENVKVLTAFDNKVIKNQLEQFIPISCKIVDEDCSRCKFENGIPYVDDRTNCHRFFLCEYRKGSDQPIKHSFMCPWHTVWDQSKLTCVYEDATNTCSYCNAPNEYGKYAVSRNCRMYRQCNGTHPYVDKCCDIGQKFDAVSLSCVYDSSCNDKCGDDGRAFKCNKYSVADNICKFTLRQPGHPIYNMSCGAGTKFNPKLCLCDALPAGKQCSVVSRDFVSCLWTVELPFSDGLKTRAKEGSSVIPVFTQSSYLPNEKVLVNSVSQEAMFRKGYIQSWYFSYRQWQPNLLIKFRFLEDSSTNGEQVLLSNDCCCTGSEDPSLFIYTNPATGKVRGGVKMAAGGVVSVDITYNVNQYRGQWKEVTLQKAGGELKMKLRVIGTSFVQTTQGKSASDDILTRKCTLKLGGPDRNGKLSFSGKMSRFFLSNDCDVIPKDELI